MPRGKNYSPQRVRCKPDDDTHFRGLLHDSDDSRDTELSMLQNSTGLCECVSVALLLCRGTGPRTSISSLTTCSGECHPRANWHITHTCKEAYPIPYQFPQVWFSLIYFDLRDPGGLEPGAVLAR